MASFVQIGGALINLDTIAYADLEGQTDPQAEGASDTALTVHFIYRGAEKGATHVFTNDDARLLWTHLTGSASTTALRHFDPATDNPS
jgi:hypothetical protein